jgi:pimeloyl-ACP methyl ester carboxylesterase
MQRSFTPTRIGALAVIAMFVLGVAYIRLAPGPAPVSVPPDARAGALTMQPCSYETESGSSAADCGTLVVPENRNNPQSSLLALPVTRIRARSPQAAEPVFVLQGGPGISNMAFREASRYADARDVVLVGYRGIDSSVRLDCPEVQSALEHSTDLLSDQSLRAYADGFQSCATRLTASGVDLAGYSLAQRIDDMEAARVALGYAQINLLSDSAGTRTAMIYAWRYPNSIRRAIMIGVNPPGNYLMDAKATSEQIARYAGLCAKDANCGRRTDDLAALMTRTAAHMPNRWLFLPIKPGNVLVATYFGFGDSRAEGGLQSAPAMLDTWLSAAEGDASGFWLSSVLADVMFPKLFVWGEYAATAVVDAPWIDAYYAAEADPLASTLARAAMDYAWGGGRMGEAWPGSPDNTQYTEVRTSSVETLLVGGELDVATPPQIARKQLLPYLPNGKEIVLAGFGHLPTFWNEQPEATSRLINAYFASGQVDASLLKPVIVDFTPDVTLTLMAKRIAGAMIGIALVAVLSLVWMALHVHRRGGFRRLPSGAIRTLYPVVLGVGGWFAGALIVMSTVPGVPIDGPLLVVVSMAVPIGLGIYFAWVHRDWPAEMRITGLLLASGGALTGGWFGFNATSGLLALATTMVGAAVGANLVVILFDMAQDSFARAPRAATGAEEVLEPRAATV